MDLCMFFCLLVGNVLFRQGSEIPLPGPPRLLTWYRLGERLVLEER